MCGHNVLAFSSRENEGIRVHTISPAIFKGNSFCDPFAFLDDVVPPKMRSALKEKNLLIGPKSFLYELIPGQKVGVNEKWQTNVS